MSEGAVIVVSILLAFGIDALWAQRQLRIEEQEALVSLQVDFTTNLRKINEVIDKLVVSQKQFATLVRLSPEEIRALPPITVSEIMKAAADPWTFDPVLGTTDALVGAGKLGVIRETKLRESLITFLNLLSDSIEDSSDMRFFAREVWLAEVKHGGPWSDPLTEIGHSGQVPGIDFIHQATPEDLLNVRGDVQFIGLSSRFQIAVGYYVSELERIRDQIELILNLIDEST